MKTELLPSISLPRIAAAAVFVLLHGAVPAQDRVAPDFQNRWHRGTSEGAPVATSVLNGHIGETAGDAHVPQSATYAIVRSQFGLPVYGVLSGTPAGDSDGDGLPDAWEETYSLNPNSDVGADGAGGDPDDDTWSNLEEYYGNSNPRSATSLPTPNVTILDVSAGTALIVGGSPISVQGVFINSGCTVTVGGESCANVAVVKVDGLSTLTAAAPPGSEGTVQLIVADPASSTSDTWQDAIAYTADPFSPDLDTTPGVVRSWNDGTTATLYAYLPSSGDVTMTTPQGTELIIPAALRTGYQGGFILARDAARLSGLPLDQTPATPDGFIAATPVLDIGGLVDNGGARLEIDEPFAEAVTVTFPLTVGTTDDALQLGYIETHLEADLRPFCAVAPGESPELTAGAAPTSVDPGANTATFELYDFTAYAGITPGVYAPSDVNQDGAVNAVDVQLVINEALGLDTGFDCDVDRDGAVNAIDVQLVINAALGL